MSAASAPPGAAGMDGLVRATFARYRPKPFVSANSLARMLRLGAALPGAATSFFGFECRLGGAAPEADFLVCIARDGHGPEALAAALERAPPDGDPFWPRLAAFCRRWTDPAGPWHAVLHNIWLEFDLAAAPEGAPVPVPSVFAGTRALRAGADPALADSVMDALDLLAGTGPSAARRAALRRGLAALPPGGMLFQLGIMLSRGDDRVRVCASGLGAVEAEAYLGALGLADPTGGRAALLAELAPMLQEIRLALDAGPDGIGPRIGVECYGGDGAEAPRRWLALFGWLVARGLALPAEREALLMWWGLQHSRLLRADWPAWTDGHPACPPGAGQGALWRSVHHVKLSLEAAGALSAKAYLASSLEWPDEVALRRLLQSV
jgi:hypothetical protein